MVTPSSSHHPFHCLADHILQCCVTFHSFIDMCLTSCQHPYSLGYPELSVSFFSDPSPGIGINWKSSNSEVYTNDNNASLVYLHGNHIATVTYNKLTVFDGGWQSNTTKSRLNALINEFADAYSCGIFQKNFSWFLTDRNETVEFESGYTFATA